MVPRWYSLIDRVYCMDSLHQAYQAVCSISGALGVDGETVEESDD